MRRATMICAAYLWATMCLTQSAVGQTPAAPLQGTLVRIVPQQGLVIKTRDGSEVNVPVAPTNQIEVRAPIDLATVPDNAPCRVHFGNLKRGAKELEVGEIRLQTSSSPQGGSGTILLTQAGDVEFQSGVPGLLKKGPPATFQVGATQYRVRTPTGQLIDAPQQGALLNQVFPIVGRGQQRTTIRYEYDFGSNLQMAGKDARVVVFGGSTPARAVIRIDRTEPLPAPPPATK
jgi:hypothetical protein